MSEQIDPNRLVENLANINAIMGSFIKDVMSTHVEVIERAQETRKTIEDDISKNVAHSSQVLDELSGKVNVMIGNVAELSFVLENTLQGIEGEVEEKFE